MSAAVQTESEVRVILTEAGPNLRASPEESLDVRLFHTQCWRDNNRGFSVIVSFFKSARSEYSQCFGCKKPINGEPQ